MFVPRRGRNKEEDTDEDVSVASRMIGGFLWRVQGCVGAGEISIALSLSLRPRGCLCLPW